MPESQDQATAPDLTPTPEPTEATTKANWKSPRKEGFMVTLPSGNAARLRRTLDLVTLMKAGRIPNPLMGIVNEMITGRRKALKMEDLQQDELIELMKLIDACLPGIFLEPRVVPYPADLPVEEYSTWEPEGDAMAIGDIDQPDRMFAFAFAQGGPKDLATFREQESRLVEGGEDGSDLPDISIPADGPRG